MAAMNSGLFKSVVEPLLNKVYDDTLSIRKNEWKAVFSEEDGEERDFQEEVVLYGLDVAPAMPDGMPVTYGQGGELFKKRFQYEQYALGYAMTKVLVEDGKAGRLGPMFARSLAEATNETIEIKTANELNRAFNGSFLGGDGVVLCSAAHPTARGGTYSNVLAVAAALSQTSVEQMLTQVFGAVNNEGKKAHLTAQSLVVSPSNVLQANVVLNSMLRSGTNNNDINPLAKYLPDGVEVVSRLTSTTAWWMKTSQTNGLKVVWRRKPTRSMEGDFETNSMRYKMDMRLQTGWVEARRVFGTPGA